MQNFDAKFCCYISISLHQKFFTYIVYTLATSVDGLLDEACVARDLTTPSKPALAIDLLLDDPRIVTSAAAEQLTALDPGTSRIALTICRP